MSQGLRIWDSNGALTHDITDSLARLHGLVTIGSIAPRSTIFFSVPGYSTDSTWFLFLLSGDFNFLQITEGSNGILIFNNDYFFNRGNVVISVFRT